MSKALSTAVEDMERDLSYCKKSRKELADKVSSLEAERDLLEEKLEEARKYEGVTISGPNFRIGGGGLIIGPPVPRVIIAEELRDGQVIAVLENGGDWTVGTVTDDLFLKLNHSRALMDIERETDGTIVLLADAPEPAEPAEDSPKRLTVEDLDAAPVGSVVANGAGLAVRKDVRGDWTLMGSGNARYTPEQLLQWPTATLTLPEKPERRGEVISRGDLCKGDVIDLWRGERLDSEGHTIQRLYSWAWDGYEDEEIRLVRHPEPEPEPELPAELGSVILVTEFKGEALDEPIYAVADGVGYWWARFGGIFPDGGRGANPVEITGWKKARIVTEDGE